MKRYLTAALALFTFIFTCALPSSADPITMLDGFQVQTGKVGMRADSVELRSSGSTGIAKLKFADSSANSPTITVPDSGSNASLILSGGTAYNQAKKQAFTWSVNNGGTLADGTTYKTLFCPGRAGLVTKISAIAGTAPIGGTSTIKVQKGVGGNTCLSAASVDPTSLADGVGAPLTLTSTAADITFTATNGFYLEWVTGTQTTDAATASITVEFEPDDI